MRTDWFTAARFGMFVHFGLYSLPGGVWHGRRISHPYAEWLQSCEGVAAGEYRALADVFDPADFDAREWIACAKCAGMRYFIITAKHHDGFALWPTKASDFNIAATPFGRDIIGELSAACKEAGVRFGVYYSHWLDWLDGDVHESMVSRGYAHPTEAQFDRYWQEKCLPQVAELLAYEPDLFWFDTWDDPYSQRYVTREKQKELIRLIRDKRPDALISSRIQMMDPDEDADFISCRDNCFPEAGFDKPWETSGTLNASWGYHKLDFAWKDAAGLIGNLMHNAALGGNYQLNVGPDGRGRFSPAARRRLKEIGAWLEANGEAVYGTRAGGMAPDVPGCVTRRDGALYVMPEAPAERFTLPVRAKNAFILETGQPVTVKGNTFILPPEARALTLPVIKIVEE